MNNLHVHKKINYDSKSDWAHSHPIHSLDNSHFHRKIVKSENKYRHNNSLDCDKIDLSA